MAPDASNLWKMILTLGLLLIGLIVTVLTDRYFRRNQKLILLAVILLICCLLTAEILLTGTPGWLVPVLAVACVFAVFRLHQKMEREHEQALVAEQRIQLMISQIQPHFLFNTLSTIQALCRIDPEKAFDTTEKFGAYLRMNIESLGQSSLIPFQKELEHTKIYADIEMLRIPSIRIIYDIRDDDFELPALSVQPMVENAIRHGVRGKYGGEVIVSSYEDDRDHVITIRDNGRGFDVNAPLESDGSHIGIRNVRERIETMCQGSMSIDSEIWKGTTVTIKIPANPGRKEK